MKRPHSDGCEWSPTKEEACYDNDPHWLDPNVVAEFIVGAKGQWRLCAECAALPRFKRFKKKAIKRGEHAQEQETEA